MGLDLGKELWGAIGKSVLLGLSEITTNSQLGHKNSYTAF